MSTQTLSYCAEQARRYDNDRFLCALFAPAGRRDALFALLAFNVEVAGVREVVSEPVLGQVRLQWWREAVDAAFAGTPPRHQVAAPLADAVAAYGLSRDRLMALIDAREADLEDGPPDSMADLVGYAEATSATLTRLVLEVLGAAEDDEAAAAGRDVGVAWALTGLLRAVPHHAAQRRSYLPRAVAREAGLDMRDVLELRQPPELARAVEAVAERAGQHLAAARHRRHAVSRAAIPALLPATLADGYLKRLRRVGYNPFALRPGGKVGRQLRLLLNAGRATF
jgi:phytoene synthase